MSISRRTMACGRSGDSPERLDLTVGFVSLGCAKNLVDSQLMAGHLVARNIPLAPSPEEADVVIVNTCAFIEDARKESLDAIRQVCELKKFHAHEESCPPGGNRPGRVKGRCRAVLVAGCLAQRYRDSLQAQLPGVDAIVGLDEIDRVAEIVGRLARGERGIREVSARSVKTFEPPVPGIVFTGGPFAYLKIAEGCDHRCAFCAIPGIRGGYRSRPAKRLIREAEQLLASGVRELNLISQDIMAYGRDRDGGRSGTAGLPGLLRELGGIGGRFWIRLLYGYAGAISRELIEAIRDVPQVCHYLDVPIQHSHPEILRAMGRGATAPHVRRLTERLRGEIPDLAIRTTCLVGFPGETEAHFHDLLEFVKEARFDHLGVFVFSPEEGTPAARLSGRPPPERAEERRARLLAAQQQIAAARGRECVGQPAEILLERPAGRGNNAWIGRSRRQAPDVDGVTRVSPAPRGARAGDFVSAVYTAAAGYDMKARAVKRRSNEA